jgi:hypothetical protein
LKVFDHRVLMSIFEPVKVKVNMRLEKTEQGGVSQCVHLSKYYKVHESKYNRRDGACRTSSRRKKCMQYINLKAQEKGPVRKSRCT